MTAVLLASLVDADALLKSVAAAAVAGLGVTLIFSLALYGAVRFTDLSRDERRFAAAVAAAVAVAGAIAFIGAVVVGIVVMTQK
jgi:hypothetical protein